MFTLPNLFIYFSKIVTQWPWDGGYLKLYEEGLWPGQDSQSRSASFLQATCSSECVLHTISHLCPSQSRLCGINFYTSPSCKTHLHLCKLSPGSVHQGSSHICSPTIPFTPWDELCKHPCYMLYSFPCSFLICLHSYVSYYVIFIARMNDFWIFWFTLPITELEISFRYSINI